MECRFGLIPNAAASASALVAAGWTETSAGATVIDEVTLINSSSEDLVSLRELFEKAKKLIVDRRGYVVLKKSRNLSFLNY
jgi:hypothetical protein